MNKPNQVSKEKPKFSVAIKSDMYKNLIAQTLGDKERAVKFTAAIMSAVAINPALQKCDAATILTGALVGEALELSHSPQLGHYYLVPYNLTGRGHVAQFQLGYKGYIQLAIRSGQYTKINVVAVKEGELKSYNPFDEELDFDFIQDPLIREKAQTIGYYAAFQLVNGFKKSLYWSKEQMLTHAKKYSKAYKGTTQDSFWHKDFDAMAFKTLLRQLISKWGIMSIEMQQAYATDMGIKNEDGTVNYIDVELDDDKKLGSGEKIIKQEDILEDEEITPPEEEKEETGEDIVTKYKQESMGLDEV